MRKLLIIPIAFILLSATLIAVLSQIPSPAPRDVTPLRAEKTYPIPPQIQPLITQLGINQSTAQKIQYYISPTNPCGEGAWGCYYNKQIWIDEPATYKLAHEYLHYIYQTNPELKSLPLQAHYNSNPLLRQGMRNYSPQEIETELFSVICTQVADYKLSPDILQACTKYLPNRSALPSDY